MTATEKWTQLANLPTPRSDLCAAAYGTGIYVFGGNPSQPYPNPRHAIVERYDIPSDTWRRVSNMPTGRDGTAAHVVNGYIYLGTSSAWQGTRACTPVRAHTYFTFTDTRYIHSP